MRRTAVPLIGLLAAACVGEDARTFGRSYDECILKNANGNPAQSVRVERSCRRRFERPSMTGRGVTGSARLLPLGERSLVIFKMANNDNTKIITGVEASASLRDGPDVTISTWPLETFIEPGDQVEVEVEIWNHSDEPVFAYERAPTFKVKREIPLPQ